MSQQQNSGINLKEAVDKSHGYFFLTDGRSVVLYANQTLQDTTGFSVAEIVGKRPGDLWGGEMSARFYERMWREIGLYKKVFSHKVLNKAKGGRVYRQKLFIAPVLNDKGESQYFLSLQPFEGEMSFRRLLGHWNRLLPSQQLYFFTEKIVPRIFRDVPPLDRPARSPLLVDFLRDVFVLPTRERFQRREDDGQLVLAAQKDPVHFRFLYERYYGEIYRYFFHHVGGEARQAEDLCQDTFLRAFRYLPQYRLSNASYGTYLFRIAHSLLVNFYRRQLRTVPYNEALAGDEDFPASVAADDIWRFVAQLSEVERQVVVMKYQDEMSVREIAEALQKSENAIKLHLSRARRKLRSKISTP